MRDDWKKQAAAWFLFGMILLAICILSFQSGAATRALDGPLVDRLTGKTEDGIRTEMVDRIIFCIRQTGRAVIFFLLGGSWGLASCLSFRRWSGRKRLICGTVVLLSISYVTEKAKIFIAGRHYEFAEFVESFLCCMMGYLLLAGLLRRKRRRETIKEDGEVSGGWES